MVSNPIPIIVIKTNIIILVDAPVFGTSLVFILRVSEHTILFFIVA